MCGIVGYIGKSLAAPILVNGLRRLEYRGYDSAGIGVLGEHLQVFRAKGEIDNLEGRFVPKDIHGTAGIGHTRWATHGEPVERNAHPHQDCTGSIAVVHNGIIENYRELRDNLSAKGHNFDSDTDSEVIPHLIEEAMAKGTMDLCEASLEAVNQLEGTFGIAVVSRNSKDEIFVARMGSPVVLGIGKGEMFVASDANAILEHTRQVVFLEDGEMACVRADGYQIRSLENLPIAKQEEHLDWTFEATEKNGQPHFMLKEMLEQPEVIQDSLRGRLIIGEGRAHLGGLEDVAERLREIDRLIVVGCGSAFYAGLVGEYMLEEIAGLPVEVELASEFRYRKPAFSRHTAVLAVSQSGETADTLAAIRTAKQRGMLTLGMVNSVGSTIARETDAGIYNHAGPEIGVASTKAFISQLTIFGLLTLFLGRQRTLSQEDAIEFAKALALLPEQVSAVLDSRKKIEAIARKYSMLKNCLFVGRKGSAPIAYEGALKLKEISYAHAEGYAAGEMKHGPIALIDKNFPSIVVCPEDSVYKKTISNIEELKARGGPIIAITTEGNTSIKPLAEDVIFVPKTIEPLQPILSVIPLQLFAYYMATERGFNPDKPRNLAKSVTVE